MTQATVRAIFARLNHLEKLVVGAAGPCSLSPSSQSVPVKHRSPKGGACNECQLAGVSCRPSAAAGLGGGSEHGSAAAAGTDELEPDSSQSKKKAGGCNRRLVNCNSRKEVGGSSE